MAQITAQMPTTTSSAPLNSIRAPQSQIEERRARYPGLVVQQPDQANVRGAHNLAEVQQGLKELQEKISSTLKRSSSAAHIRPTSNISTMMSPQVPGIVLKTESSETSQKTIDSFYQSRTNITSSPSTPAYVMSNVSSTALLRGNLDGFHLQSPQASSNKFYLGSLNPNYGRKEELLNSIKNYQVKTIHTLNAMHSSRTTQQSSHTFSHNIQPMRVPHSLGASMLSNPISFEGFQPGYDRERLDSVVSKIMGSQSFNGVRQDSFMSTQKFTDMTGQDSLLTSKLDESNIPKRKAPQQARPVKKTQPAAKKEQKPSAVRETRKQPKGSHCDDFGADGDSMILEFIKEKDQIQDFFEDDFTGRTAKRGREVEEEQPQPKKLSKRQEILSSKRQVKGPAQEPKKLRKDSNATSQSGEASQKNKRRY